LPVGDPYCAYPSLRPSGRVKVEDVLLSRRKRHGVGDVGGDGVLAGKSHVWMVEIRDIWV
jgi:hypothetical protein